jgi:hypothetical protein
MKLGIFQLIFLRILTLIFTLEHIVAGRTLDNPEIFGPKLLGILGAAVSLF